jgi:putative phosphoesterase
VLLAALGDIHGNLPALEAVLRDVDDAGIQTILNTGDCVVGFPWPNEVVELVRDREIPTAQGELDRFAVRFTRKEKTFRDKWPHADYEALRWTHENTRSEYLEWLRGLPKTVSQTLEDITIVVCHGTLSSLSEQLLEEDPIERFERQRENANSRIVICGRTHRGFKRFVADTLFVNPGSVGMPSDAGSLASYAIIDTERNPWRVTHKRVVYDMGVVEKRLQECGLERP